VSNFGSLRKGNYRVFNVIRWSFEKFVDWWQYAAVMQRKAATVIPNYSDGGNIVVA
jgi:hypothetical protein